MEEAQRQVSGRVGTDLLAGSETRIIDARDFQVGRLLTQQDWEALDEYLQWLRNHGSLLLGAKRTVAYCDKPAGTNQVLPAMEAALDPGPLGGRFLKRWRSSSGPTPGRRSTDRAPDGSHRRWPPLLAPKASVGTRSRPTSGWRASLRLIAAPRRA